jgi:hypothetical protein
MSASDWLVVLADQWGTPCAVLEDMESLALVVGVGQAGAWQIVVPAALDQRLLRPDARLEFWYRRALLAVGFLQRWQQRDSAGTSRTALAGVDQNSLLARRIIAYYANSTASSKSGPADDLMKAIVRENLGALATDAERDWTVRGLTVQADLARGPNVDCAFAWRNVAPLLTDLAAMAESAGTTIYYSVVPLNGSTFEFRTWMQQPGRDRTSAGPDPLLLGTAYGNLAEAALETDYTAACSFVYAAGQGTNTARAVVEVWDPTAVAASPFARSERLADARNAGTANEVEAAGRAALLAGQVRQRFTGTILDGPGCRFGQDWKLGDRVSAEFRGQEFDCLIGTVDIRLDRSGDRIRAQLERDVARPRAIATAIWPGGS